MFKWKRKPSWRSRVESSLGNIERMLEKQKKKLEDIMATEQEANEKLDLINEKLAKVHSESQRVIALLEEAQAGQGVPDSVMANIELALTGVQGIDDLVVDEEPPVDNEG